MRGMRFTSKPRLAVEERGLRLDPNDFRSARERANLTIPQLAEKLGLEEHVISGIEKGYRVLSPLQAKVLYLRIELLEQARLEAQAKAAATAPPAMRVKLPQMTEREEVANG
ncbi:MAG TPA: hypothetical protein PLB01_00280 [Thermoanaerobaculia bacterium]|nr:hypothetical protein [Thermoanaerobaculia bacterium]